MRALEPGRRVHSAPYDICDIDASGHHHVQLITEASLALNLNSKARLAVSAYIAALPRGYLAMEALEFYRETGSSSSQMVN